METVFGLINVATLPWWLSMLLFPSSRATLRMVTSPWPFVVLAAAYLALLLSAIFTGPAPASLDAAALASAFASPWGFLAAWMHMLALDLFAGVWIFRDARFYGRVPRLELLATWWTGPIGLGVYL
ncbi:MAG: abscisic acid-deficient protein Aba4 family protein, partial [Trueperaceae bacterium]